jgi:hypothetical protein
MLRVPSACVEAWRGEWWGRVGFLWLAGALGGALCDQIHVQAGVLAYRHPTFLDQSWWVGPQFGVAVVAMIVGAVPAARLSTRAAGRPGARMLVTDTLWFVAAYAASGLWGNDHARALAVVYGLTWVARLAVRPDWLALAAVSVTLVGGGVLYEGTLAGTGAFHYIHPGVYHVPIWLAGIYLHGAPLLVNVTRLVLIEPASEGAGPGATRGQTR